LGELLPDQSGQGYSQLDFPHRDGVKPDGSFRAGFKIRFNLPGIKAEPFAYPVGIGAFSQAVEEQKREAGEKSQGGKDPVDT